MSEGLPLKPLQPARPLSQVHLSPGSAEEAIASIRAFGTSFPQAAGTQTAQTSTTLPLPTVPVTEQSQQPQTGAPPAKKPRRRQPKKAQEQASTSQLSIPQGSQQVQQPQAEASPSQKARQPRKSLKRTIDSVEPSASQEGPATKKPALQVSQPTQPEIQALPSTVALQASQQAQQSQTEALPSQKAKQPRKSLKRSIDSVEPSTSQEGPATKKPALQVSQPAQPEIEASPPTVALQASQPTQPEIEASPSTVTLQASQSPQPVTHAPPATIDLPPHQPAQQLQFQAPRTDPIPGAWWEIPGFSEAFKQFHRDRYGKEGTLKPIVVQGLINVAVIEHQRLLAAAARQAAENQGAANPTAPEQETDPVSASLLGLVNLSGGPSSEMGTDNQQTAIDLPIDPQLQAEYDASSMDPRAHTIHVGGVKLSQVGLGPDPALPKDEVDGRFTMIEDELENQKHSDNIPIPKPSQLPKQPPKEFVGSTYLMPPGVKDARLDEVLKQRNDIILNKQKQVDLGRNNLAAKGTRERREEKEKNFKKIISKLQIQMNWWRLKAISLGANAGEWNAISEDHKNTMLKDMDEKVCQAEKAQSVYIKGVKGLEHSTRNSINARLSKLDTAKKEKEVQAITATIEAKDRERQEAQSQGQELPEMDLKEFVNMIFPDDVIHVDATTAAGVTTGDTAEAPTPINDNQNDSIQANTSGPININGVPVEPTANTGESADAGGTIEHPNTTDVNNTMDVGNPINNNNSSMNLDNTMDGNALTMDEDTLNTDNMVSGHAINNSSLPPNNWAYQAYAQTDNTPNMSIDFQGVPLNNYGMQDNDMLSNDMLNNGMQNWVPGGTVMDNEFQGDALGNFNPQSNDFLSLEPQDNGFMQSNPQDTLFDTDDMQGININTDGFQRITALDDCTQGSTSLDYPMHDNTPLDTSLYGNASLGNSTQCSTSLDYNVQGDADFDTSIFSNASIDSGTQNNASVNYGPQGSLPTNNGIYDAAPYNNLIQDNASRSTNPQGNGNATIKQKPNRVTKVTKPSRASKSNGRNVKKPEAVRREFTAADLPRVANPTPHNAFNPAVLARARLDHIDHADRYAFGGRPPSASQQIITPRARDFVNDKHLTYENSFTPEGNQSLFTAHYETFPSDDERNQF
ncbi:hypothetical protein FAGAP_8267 [Fusarium agapanthi]|uniref:BZIP domain-containing protein n=1 Tax=Fusarium agapanthi TaxID=1803897 RepID=A0A9P5B606_9HYPO|nr:hypothetical protein FAGAP_8267 [Fusarium agapanthi]